MSDSESGDERHTSVAEGYRVEQQDHALVRLDEKEVRARMFEAFNRFVQMGFEAHLVGVKARKAIEYSLVLAEDGGDDLPIRDIQVAADEFRLDIFVAKGRGLVLYARW